MRIARATLYRYRLPLAKPLTLGPRTLREREGLLIRLESDRDAKAWGDIAPLPAFSPETLAKARQAARSVCADLEGHLLTKDDRLLEETTERDLPPSVRFGIEQAALSLAAVRAETTLPHMLSDAPRTTVYLNDLLRASDDSEAFLHHARQTEYRAVKLKVGRRSVADDAQLVHRIREALPPSTALRLDANRAWSFDEAHAFSNRVANCGVAYLEEPLRDPASLPAFANLDLLPVALDETVLDITPDDLNAHDYASAIVLKPTLLGLRRALRLGRRAEALGLTPVVSGTYESGVGTLALAALAAAFRTNAPAGLTPYRQLCDDVLAPPLNLNGASVDVPGLFGATPRIERRSLKLLPK